MRKFFTVRAGHHQLNLGRQTQIMGVLNVTPDSFSGDGCLRKGSNHFQRTILKARKFIRDGADIIDIGGESTRPGSKRISISEERVRVIPVLKALIKKVDVPLSVDTYKARVAQEALDEGASIINNIMGVSPDRKLLKMIRDYKCALVLMHIQGTPRTMQNHIHHYNNVVTDIIGSLKKSIDICLDMGIQANQLIVDPGIGFGKTVEHNLQIINRLSAFQVLKRPILIGTSRKSFIGKVLNRDVGQRLTGTLATVCAGIMKGAHIVRVHDIKEVRETISMTEAVLNEGYHHS